MTTKDVWYLVVLCVCVLLVGTYEAGKYKFGEEVKESCSSVGHFHIQKDVLYCSSREQSE